MPLQDSDQYGAFIQTTQVWDVEQVEQIDVNSKEFKELLVRLYQQINNIANVLNIKDTGQYQLSEYVNGQQFFSNPALDSSTDQYPQDRQVIRKVINFGALGVATKSVAHGITCITKTTFTRIYGVANKTTAAFSYLPLPYAGLTSINNNIELLVDATNVTINNGIDRSSYDTCYVILEFIQS